MTAQNTRNNLLLPGIKRWSTEQGPTISLKSVHKSFGDKHVLRGLDLEIEPGTTTVIIGASASGKSVLIKLMNGLIKADKGEVSLFGEDPRKLGAQALDRLRQRMGTLFQNYALFDSMTVEQNVAFPLVQSGVVKEAEALKLAKIALEELELGHVLREYPATLSGGMKKRVSLARALIANPELVLFDEPTTGLDPIMMEFVDDMIITAQKKFALTSVVISHDMASTFRLADSIAVLHDGKILAHDTPDAIRAHPDERIQRLINASDKTAIAMPVAGAQQKEEADEPIAVKVRGLRKAFDGREVLKGVDFSAPEKKISVLIGGSGSGKSVLMKHILGLFKPDAGTIEVLGENLVGIDEQGLVRLRTRVGMLFQSAALLDSLTVEQNIAFPLRERRDPVSLSETNERVQQLIEQLKLNEIARAYPSAISNGQQKRVSLARALATRPEMMIYDEPTTGQDPIMCAYVEEMIVEVQETFKLTSLVISHDMASTFRIGDHVAMLYKGEMIAEGPPASLLNTEDERVKSFVFAADVAEEKDKAKEAQQGLKG
jgi:ABC-type transporter Mla maintaining outer membrane lipid asymmetry ATPase subunit MlaF